MRRGGSRIEQLWQAHQQDPGSRPYRSSQLAHRLGVTDAYVRHVTWQLRTRAGIAPLVERLAAAREQLTSIPPPSSGPADPERDWRQDAACRNVDPELFFPDPGQLPQTAKAKEVCAGCAVREPCLDTALHGPLARDDHDGIFAGTTARDRTRLRGRPSMAEGTQFLRDRDAAEQAWRRAAAVGINQTRKELGTSDKALWTAWQRHGLGLPPRPAARPAPSRPLDPAFVALNHDQLPTPRGPRADQGARLRRDEEIQTLGYPAVVALNGESRVAPKWRVAAVTRRAQRAQRPHHPRAQQEREVRPDS